MSRGGTRVAGSFRDPAGFVFLRGGELYRQINRDHSEDYEHLLSSGLYDGLVEDGMLIPHEEVSLEHAATDNAHKVIRPEKVPFVSYPYEWCFSQLKDAALLTLDVQMRAMDAGLSLRDSSAYNIQFLRGRPVLIDTLSLGRYREGTPWVAYRQFCQHFLAPLALVSRVDARLHTLLRVHLDGVPLDLASRLLPVRTRASFGLLSHIHLHAKAQQRFAGGQRAEEGRSVSRMALLGLVDSLRSAVGGLRWEPGGTEWHDYDEAASYTTDGLTDKRQLVGEMLDAITPAPASVWDLGANTGLFSRLASGRGMPTISFDKDPAAVEENYRECVATGEANILPLVLDLTNPSPGIGWENSERASVCERGPADAALALALIHHLAISNNVPLPHVARLMSRVCRWLIIEFVPKSDPQVQKLLRTREDIFAAYDQEGFEHAFLEQFSVHQCERVTDGHRVLYLMERRIP